MKKLIIITLLFIFFNCKNSVTKENLTYQVKEKRIRIELSNNKKYLEYNTPIKMNFILSNIDPNNLSIVGCGIKILGYKENRFETEINVSKQCGKNNILNVRVEFGKEKQYNHEFNIPLKKTK